MTCIVAIATPDGRVCMGADSAGVAGLSMSIRRDEKLFIKSNMVFGCTGSFRMIQLLRFHLIVGKRHPDTDLYEYMCTSFIGSVRDCFRSGGYLSRDHDVEGGGHFMVGVEGRIFSIQQDLQIGERQDCIDACGCGAELALGSLHQSQDRGFADIRRRLEDALSTAERFCAGVRGPFVFKETTT